LLEGLHKVFGLLSIATEIEQNNIVDKEEDGEPFVGKQTRLLFVLQSEFLKGGGEISLPKKW